MRQVSSGLGLLYIPPDTGGSGWDWFDGGWGFDDYWGAGSSWDSFLGLVPAGAIETIIRFSRGTVLPVIIIRLKTPTTAYRFPCRVPLVQREGRERGRGAAHGPGDRRAALLLRLLDQLRLLPVLLRTGSRRGAVCLLTVQRGSYSTRVRIDASGFTQCSPLLRPQPR